MAEKKYLLDLNLNGNQVKNVVAEGLTADPAGSTAGRYYYNTTDKSLRYFNGTSWIILKSATVYSATSLAEDGTNQFKIYDSTTGSQFKFRAIKGGNKITLTQSSGVISIALATLAVSDISGLSTELGKKVDKTTTVAGKALSANVTLDALTVGTKTYDGSKAVTITAADLGVSNVFSLKGRKDTLEEVEAVQSPAIGDVWLVGEEGAGELEEYVYTTESKWEKLGITTKVDLSDYYTKSQVQGIKVTAGGGLAGGGAVGSGLTTTISHATNTPINNKGTNDFVSGITFDQYGHPDTVTYGKLPEIPEIPDITVTGTGGTGKVMTNLTPEGHQLTPVYKNESELLVAGFAQAKSISLTGAVTGTASWTATGALSIKTSIGADGVRRVEAERTGADEYSIEISTSGMKEVSVIKTYVKTGTTYDEVELQVSVDASVSSNKVIKVFGNNISALTILIVVIGI